MEIKKFNFYFIDNNFFDLVNDPNLTYNQKVNKNTYRPHYYALKDWQTNLLWMVPCSHQIKKWQSRIKKYKNKNRAVIVNTTQGKEVLIFQNMFPIAEKYIAKEYTSVSLYEKENLKKLTARAIRIYKALESGYKFSSYTPDIKRIHALMLNETNQ